MTEHDVMLSTIDTIPGYKGELSYRGFIQVTGVGSYSCGEALKRAEEALKKVAAQKNANVVVGVRTMPDPTCNVAVVMYGTAAYGEGVDDPAWYGE